MSWTDEDIDRLFSDAADGNTLEFKEEFWSEIEANLPVQRKNNRLFFLGGMMAIVLLIIPGTLMNIKNEIKIQESYTAVNNGELKTDALTLKSNAVTEVNSVDRIEESSKIPSRTLNSFNGVENDESSLPVIDNKKNERYASEGESLSSAKEENLSIQNEINRASETNEISGLARLDVNHLIQTDASLINRQMLIDPLKKGRFFIEINGGMGESPISGSESGSSFIKTSGLQVGYLINQKNFRLSSGAGITNYWLDNVFIKERTKMYGYSSQIVEKQYDFNRIVALSLPVKIEYVTRRHHFGINVQISKPLSCKIDKSLLVDYELEISTEGYTNADLFSKVWIQSGLSYSFNIQPNWELGANFNLQLNNQIGSVRFKGERNSFPLSGTVSLKHILNW